MIIVFYFIFLGQIFREQALSKSENQSALDFFRKAPSPTVQKWHIRGGPSFGNFCLWERFPNSRKLSFGKVFESFYSYQKKVCESIFSLKCFENFVLVEFSNHLSRNVYQNKVCETFERKNWLANFLLVRIEWFENFTKWKFSWIWKSLSQA